MNQSVQKKTLRSLAIFFLTTAMALGSTCSARGDEKIRSVDLHIEYELAHNMAKSDVEADSGSDGVDSVVVSSIKNVEYGQRPRVVVKVRADRDYTFRGLSNRDITLSGDKASVAKVSVSGRTLTVSISLPKIGTTEDTALEVGDVYWGDDDDGSVGWDQADDANRYEVKLMRGSSTRETIQTSGTRYNFRSAIRGSGRGTYSVKVRAIAGSYKGKWVESDDWEIDEDTLKDLGGKIAGSSSEFRTSGGPGNGSYSATQGAWMKDGNGWWYSNADRSYTVNNWQKINNNWYYFNKDGYMVTGWLQSPFSKKWYYLDPSSGRMLTSQWVDNGKYYVDANGIWISDSGSGSGGSGSGKQNGSEQGAWLKDKNGWWYCNADRSYTSNNWQKIEGAWYFFDRYGYRKTGWLQSPFSKKWYYLDPSSGRMLTSRWVDNGRYYVDADGVWKP